MAAYEFRVNGVLQALQPGWSIQENANGLNRFDGVMLSLDGTDRFELDDIITFTEDGTRIFGGLIDRPTESGLFNGGATARYPNPLSLRFSAVSFDVYASRIRLTADIPAGTFKAFLTVIAAALADQGVTLDPAQVNGPALPAVPYNDTPIIDVLNDAVALASGTGATSWVWEIDYNKVLRGFEAGTESAPFNIVDDDGHVQGDIVVEQARSSEYGNYITLDGGTGQQDVTEGFTGDGVTSEFFLDYRLAVLPSTVQRDDGPPAVLETLTVIGGGGQWEYDPDAGDYGSITRVAAPPSIGDAISITYTAQFPRRVTADGGLPAASRVMRAYTREDIFDVDVLEALVESYLARDMAAPKTVRYPAAFDLTDIHPGQTQTITSPKRNLSGTATISAVTIRNVAANFVQRFVTAVTETRLRISLRESIQQAFGSRAGASSGGSVTVVTGGGVGGTGTTGKLVKWTGTNLIGDSILSESGTVLTVSGSLVTTGGITAGSGAVGIVNSAGKIPEISTTYFASVSGANLQNLNASAVNAGNLPYANLPTGAGTWTATPTITGQVTLSSGLEASGSVNTGTSLQVTRAFSSTAGSGAFLALQNADTSRRWYWQPDADNHLRLWYYNGSVFSQTAKFHNDGALTLTANLAATSAAFSAAVTFSEDIILAATKKVRLDGSASGDTYLSESSGNRIDVVAGGTTALSVLANAVQVGSDVDLSVQATKRVYLDGGVDTYVVESSANTVSVVAGGATSLTLTAAGVAVPGTLGVTGAATFSSTLAATGAVTFSSTLAVAGNMAVNTNKFTVAAASGNTAVAGTLDVTGAVALAATLSVTGAVTMSSTLAVSGAVTGGTYNGQTITSTASFTGSVAIATTLGVAGAVTLSSTLAVTGTTTLTGAVTVGSTVGTSSYVSQTTGWRVTSAGEADFRYLYVDELYAKAFIADLEQALAGGQIITKSVAMVHAAFTVPARGAAVASITRSGSTATVTTATAHGFSSGDTAYISGADQNDYNGNQTVTVTSTTEFTYTVANSPATPATGTIIARGSATLSVKDLPGAADMQVFQDGDTVVLRAFSRTNGGLVIGDCIGGVTSPDTSPSGYQTWLFLRNLSPNGGSLARGATVQAESLALDYGTSGSGYYEVSAVDGMVTVTTITRSSNTATVTTDFPHGFLSGDIVYVSGSTNGDYDGAFTITVTSPTTFTYTVLGSPATPATGTILVNGTNGTNAAYAQVVTWATAPTGANKTLRARFGNLRGVTGTNNDYGLIAGTYAATNGAYFRASNNAFELHGITSKWWSGSTNVVTIAPNSGSPYLAIGNPAPSSYGNNAGLFLGWVSGDSKAKVSFYADANNYFQYNGSVITWKAANTTLDASGNLTASSATLSGAITATSGSITGGFTIGTSGSFASGATAFGTGTGIWMDYNGGTPRARVGTTSGNRFSWDGTDLTVVSSSVNIDSTGILVTPSSNGYTAAGSYRFASTWGVFADASDAGPSKSLLVQTTGAEDGGWHEVILKAATTNFAPTITVTAEEATSSAFITAAEIDSFTIKGREGVDGVLNLYADQGDDSQDRWSVIAGAAFGFSVKQDGSTVAHFTDGVHTLYGLEGLAATLQLYADDGDDSGDRWALSALSASSTFRVTRDGATVLNLTSVEAQFATAAIFTGALSNAVASSTSLDFASGNARLFAHGADNSTAAGFKFFCLSANQSVGAEYLALSAAGALRLHAYGAGTLTTDASGNVTATSDERLKEIVAPFERGLSALRGVRPILHRWKPESGMEMSGEYAGFSAQNVGLTIPECIGVRPDGYLTFSDRPMLATCVNAINEVEARIAKIESLPMIKALL